MHYDRQRLSASVVYVPTLMYASANKPACPYWSVQFGFVTSLRARI